MRDVSGEAVPLNRLLNPVGPDATAIGELREEALRRDVYPAYLQGLNGDARFAAQVEKALPTGSSAAAPGPKRVHHEHGDDVYHQLAVGFY